VTKGKQSKELKEIKKAMQTMEPDDIERAINKKKAVISRQKRVENSRRKEALRETYTMRTKRNRSDD
jgi:hypothetical protein